MSYPQMGAPMGQMPITCPRHGQPMNNVNQNGVNIDVCPMTCVFLDAGELNTLLSAALQSHGVQHAMPPIQHGQPVRNPLDYVFGGFGSHGSHGRKRRRGHGGSSGSLFGGSGSD